MQLTFLGLGMFLDDTAMLVIVAPLFIPLAGALGFDLVWYGVLYTITCQIAYLTPPFGYNLFLMRAMAPPEVTLPDIYRSVFPFVGIMLLTLLIIGMFPGDRDVAAQLRLLEVRIRRCSPTREERTMTDRSTADAVS